MALRVKINGIDTGNLPKYKNKELEGMLSEIKRGNPLIREEFLLGNIRLVLSILQRFQGAKCPADDLFQVGMLGLIKATDNFDPSYNVRFSTYAVPMIEGEIRRFIREGTALKVGRKERDVAYKALQARDALETKSGNEVTLGAIAEYIDTPIDEVVASLDAIAEPLSLYDHFGEDEENLLIDKLGDYEAEDKIINNLSLKYAIDALPEKERDVVMMRYYEGQTQMEISAALDMSQAQVSRLEKLAIDRIKEAF